jgi:DNA-binding MarR family transcriptional regulator
VRLDGEVHGGVPGRGDGPAGFPDLRPIVAPELVAAGNTCYMQSTGETTVQPLVESVLTASRVLVGIAARSLAEAQDEVTLPQYRALVVLQARGPQSLQELAEQLGVVPSTATRMCDRLVRKGLIRRDPAAGDRREVELAVTRPGADLVNLVTRRRRAEISRIVGRMSADGRAEVVHALQEFARAADEPPDHAWFLGWS